MTQPTIKKKIQEIKATYYYDRHNNGYAEAMMKDFARLICEEMTGKSKVYSPPGLHTDFCINNNEFGCVCSEYNQRIAEERKKAQEILKALE